MTSTALAYETSNKNFSFNLITTKENQKIYHSFDNSNEIINFEIAFKNAGYANDEKEKLGLSFLLSSMLSQYEFGKNSDEVKELIENNAIELHFHSDPENFYISAKIIRENIKNLRKILNLIFTGEFHDEKRLEQIKESLWKNYQNNLGNANFLGTIETHKELFKDSDFGKIPYGTEETLKNIKIKDLQDLAKERFAKNNIIMSVSGNINEKELLKFKENLNKNLNDSFKPKYKDYLRQNYEVAEKNIKLKKEQILIKAYFPTIPRNNSNYYKYYLANHIIGGSGLTTILSQEIREKNGLTYSVHSFFESYNDFSVWYVTLGTDKKNYKKAIELLKKTLSKTTKKGFTKEQLERAKKYLTGSFNIYFNTNDKIASYLNESLIRQVPMQMIKNRNKLIEEIELEELNKTLKTFLNPDNISFVVVGDI